MVSKEYDLMIRCPGAQDFCSGKIGLLSRLSKLRWPLAWLVVCRNPIDVDLNFTVDLGTVLSVGALYWARNGLLGFRNLNDCSSKDAENKYNVFRLI